MDLCAVFQSKFDFECHYIFGVMTCIFLQALPYVCLLIAMLFFIYAIIGMQVIHYFPSLSSLIKYMPPKKQRKIYQIGFCYPRFSEAKLLSPILNTIVIIIFKPLWRVYWYFFGESYSIIPLYYVALLHQLTFLHHPFSLLVMISALIEIPTMIMITVVVRGQPAIFDMSM